MHASPGCRVDRDGRLDPEARRRRAPRRHGARERDPREQRDRRRSRTARSSRRLRTRAACPLHLDATQAVGKLPLDVVALGADLLSGTAHKLNGPKGVGFLVDRTRPGLARLRAGRAAGAADGEAAPRTSRASSGSASPVRSRASGARGAPPPRDRAARCALGAGWPRASRACAATARRRTCSRTRLSVEIEGARG